MLEIISVVISAAALAYFSYMLGKGSANGNVLTLKRENEQLNKELKTLTDRDSRGRFTRNESK
jgi:hypothetical protein